MSQGVWWVIWLSWEDKFFNTNIEFDPAQVYQTGSTQKATVESTLIYEIFSCLRPSEVVSGRQFKNSTTHQIKTTYKTDLVNSKMEKNTKAFTNNQVYDFLSSISQILADIVVLSQKSDNDDKI